MSKLPFYLFLIFFSFYASAAYATSQDNYTGHDGVSVSTAVTITELETVRFGNFSVLSAGGGDASIVLNHNGTRTSFNGASTQIVLLYGASQGGITNTGSQGPGHYQVAHAGATTNLYVTFTDHTGTLITSCPSGSIFLNGPVGSGQFCVDSFNFNLTGTDGTGPYITTDGSGNATIRVGATLHTMSGASYAPGTYRGTFEVQISY